MSGKAKQDVVVAANSRRLIAPIIADCVLFHRRYFSSRCAACITSHPCHLSVFRFWH